MQRALVQVALRAVIIVYFSTDFVTSLSLKTISRLRLRDHDLTFGGQRRSVIYSFVFGWASTLMLCDDVGTNTKYVGSALAADGVELYRNQSLTSLGTLLSRTSGFVQYNPVVVKWEQDQINEYGGDNLIGSKRVLSTTLGQTRIKALELSPLQQPLTPFSPNELYYSPFLFGSWNVTATLIQKVYPYGLSFVPSISLVEGSPRSRIESIGDSCSYEVHYFSTLAKTFANEIVVNLGTGIPQSKIIQDRSYNAISISRAYRQQIPVDSVLWDYRNDPTKLVLEYGTGLVADDMRPLGNRKTEVFINARLSEYNADNPNIFASAEKYRSVTLGPVSPIVSDTETITEFQRIDDDTVQALSRIAVYLTPNPNNREGILWQQVGGKAIAFFDYSLIMKRNKKSFTLLDDSGLVTNTQYACVTTPKQIVQCQ